MPDDGQYHEHQQVAKMEPVDRGRIGRNVRSGDEVILTFPDGEQVVATLTVDKDAVEAATGYGGFVSAKFTRVNRDREITVLARRRTWNCRN